MGKKLKKKIPKQKKTSQKNYDSGRINWGLCRSTSDSDSGSESLQKEDEEDLSGMNWVSSGFHPDESDTTEFSLMDEQE